MLKILSFTNIIHVLVLCGMNVEVAKAFSFCALVKVQTCVKKKKNTKRMERYRFISFIQVKVRRYRF